MTDRIVIVQLAAAEGIHLTTLVTQFSDLLVQTTQAEPRDPAVARLVPAAYPEDEEASAEFRALTQRELLDRRASDAARVLATLHTASEDPIDDEGEVIAVRLDADDLQSWLRTLAAVRLVLASRLGVVAEDDHDEDDPRFGIYDWLGYRLDGLVQAAEASP